MNPQVIAPNRNRRLSLLGMLAAVLTAPFLAPRRARSQEKSIETMVPAVKDVLQGTPARAGRVKIDTAPPADNGHSVQVTVTFEGPRTAAGHARRLAPG